MDSKSSFRVDSDVLWTRVKRLGEGTYGIVDLVKTKQPDSELFAVKTSHSPSSSIKKEYRIFQKICDTPNIIKCYGFSTILERRKKYDNLFLEYASDGTLRDLIQKSGGKISEYDTRRYTKMILEGLRCIHSRGYVHCDIKPENILVFPSELESDSVHLKLADFGSAKEPDEQIPVLSTPFFRGTPLYMSPESVNNGEITHALDIWSLGCVVTEMMTGEAPWESSFDDLCEPDADYLEDFGNMICYTVSIPDIPRNISDSGKDFLMKCFARDPRQRWTADNLLKHPFIFADESTLTATTPLLNEILFPSELKQKRMSTA